LNIYKSSLLRFLDIMRINRQTDRQTPVQTLPPATAGGVGKYDSVKTFG